MRRKQKPKPEPEPDFVTCPECGWEQGDMGTRVACETCDHYPMPSYDYPDGHSLNPNSAKTEGKDGA